MRANSVVTETKIDVVLKLLRSIEPEDLESDDQRHHLSHLIAVAESGNATDEVILAAFIKLFSSMVKDVRGFIEVFPCHFGTNVVPLWATPSDERGSLPREFLCRADGSYQVREWDPTKKEYRPVSEGGW